MDYNYREAMKLENQLCFPLYAAARTITNLYTPYLKPLGLTYTQYLVFLVLWEQDGIKNNGMDLTFHSLRHLNASVMLMLGIPDKYAMERGGWFTDSILKSVYQQTFSTERDRVDDVIDKYFSDIINSMNTDNDDCI